MVLVLRNSLFQTQKAQYRANNKLDRAQRDGGRKPKREGDESQTEEGERQRFQTRLTRHCSKRDAGARAAPPGPFYSTPGAKRKKQANLESALPSTHNACVKPGQAVLYLFLEYWSLIYVITLCYSGLQMSSEYA